MGDDHLREQYERNKRKLSELGEKPKSTGLTVAIIRATLAIGGILGGAVLESSTDLVKKSVAPALSTIACHIDSYREAERSEGEYSIFLLPLTEDEDLKLTHAIRNSFASDPRASAGIHMRAPCWRLERKPGGDITHEREVYEKDLEKLFDSYRPDLLIVGSVDGENILLWPLTRSSFQDHDLTWPKPTKLSAKGANEASKSLYDGMAADVAQQIGHLNCFKPYVDFYYLLPVSQACSSDEGERNEINNLIQKAFYVLRTISDSRDQETEDGKKPSSANDGERDLVQRTFALVADELIRAYRANQGVRPPDLERLMLLGDKFKESAIALADEGEKAFVASVVGLVETFYGDACKNGFALLLGIDASKRALDVGNKKKQSFASTSEKVVQVLAKVWVARAMISILHGGGTNNATTNRDFKTRIVSFAKSDGTKQLASLMKDLDPFSDEKARERVMQQYSQDFSSLKLVANRLAKNDQDAFQGYDFTNDALCVKLGGPLPR